MTDSEPTDDGLQGVCLHCLLVALGQQWLDDNRDGNPRAAMRMMSSFQAALATTLACFPEPHRTVLLAKVIEDLPALVERAGREGPDEEHDVEALHNITPAGSA